jgi:hypothetical protein
VNKGDCDGVADGAVHIGIMAVSDLTVGQDMLASCIYCIVTERERDKECKSLASSTVNMPMTVLSQREL